jgi:hypothetical protein
LQAQRRARAGHCIHFPDNKPFIGNGLLNRCSAESHLLSCNFRRKHCENLIRKNRPLAQFQMGHSFTIHAKSRNLASKTTVDAESKYAGNERNIR